MPLSPHEDGQWFSRWAPGWHTRSLWFSSFHFGLVLCLESVTLSSLQEGKSLLCANSLSSCVAFCLFVCFVFWLHRAAWEILVPRPGPGSNSPPPPALWPWKADSCSLNHQGSPCHFLSLSLLSA